MEQIDKLTFKNASFVMAGGVCLMGLIGYFLHIGGTLYVRGIQFVTSLVIPTLCFWVGMLIRFIISKSRKLVLCILGALMCVSYGYGICAMSHLGWIAIVYQWWGLILLGFILPWEYLYQHRDLDGIKSGIILLISALAYCAVDLVNERMRIVPIPSSVSDLGELLFSVTKIVLPFVTILTVYFAAEFSFSRAGQWLGSKKWFQVICWIAAVLLFAILILQFNRWNRLSMMWQITRILVQPVTVYLVFVIVRIIRKSGKWKEVFTI